MKFKINDEVYVIKGRFKGTKFIILDAIDANTFGNRSTTARYYIKAAGLGGWVPEDECVREGDLTSTIYG
jgi:hypothetical protein